MCKIVTMKRLFVRPIYWSSVNPDANALKTNPALFPSIDIFGYTSDERTIYIRIPRKSTFILKFSEEIDESLVSDFNDILNPSYIKLSSLDSKVIIIRAPELSPMELIDNSNYEGLATWIEAKQDPYGSVESLWESREISPYEWLTISKYVPLPGKYTSCDFNIRTDEDYISSVNNSDIKFPNITPRLLFWNVESYISGSENFPTSSNPNNYIAAISLSTISKEGVNKYLLVKTPYEEFDKIPSLNSVVIVKFNNEKDLLCNFFAIYKAFKPDMQISYGSDMFDMPYLIDRLNIYNFDIPKISKIITSTPRVTFHRYSVPFGSQLARTIIIPGTEIIDLIHYCQRFYPYFNNHSPTAINKYINYNNDNNKYINYNNDDNKSVTLIKNSFNKNIKISKLWNIDNIQNKLETVCHNIKISINVLLRSNYENIVDRAVYNIDAGSAITTSTKGKYDTPGHLREATKGIYRNVYTYDYSELYRQIMLLSEQPMVNILANRLKGAPPKLIFTAFYSIYVDKTKLIPLLNNALEILLVTNMVIALEPFLVKSVGPFTVDWVKLLNISPCYVVAAKASYITLNENGKLAMVGFFKLCRPKFKLATDIIKQYLSLIHSSNYGASPSRNELNKFVIPDLTTLTLDKFILTEKIGTFLTQNLNKYSEVSTNKNSPNKHDINFIKYKLSMQLDEFNIKEPITVKYVMTTQGPILLSKFKSNHSLDYSYYIDEINEYIKSLQSLKIYGI